MQADKRCSLRSNARASAPRVSHVVRPRVALPVQCSSSSGGGGESSRFSKRLSRRGKAKQPGLFEIHVVAPPPRSLGIFALPPLTHNGEMIDIDGSGYVVTSVVVQFKLIKGKYVREHNRLEVLPTSRWLLNQQLESLLRARYMGPPGLSD